MGFESGTWATGNRLRTLAAQPYFLVRYAADGKMTAAAQSNARNQVDLFEASSGWRLWSWSGVTKPLIDLAFTPGSELTIYVWNVAESKELGRVTGSQEE